MGEVWDHYNLVADHLECQEVQGERKVSPIGALFHNLSGQREENKVQRTKRLENRRGTKKPKHTSQGNRAQTNALNCEANHKAYTA